MNADGEEPLRTVPESLPPVTGAVRGLVSNIQRCSLHDGPGLRTTVFLKGCPLACSWCHNPENLSPQPQIIVVETRCVRCGLCLEACPQNPESPTATGPGTARPEALRPPSDCARCGACVEACPTGARTQVGRELTVAEVLEQVLADRLFYEDSGGGLTVSGGEPLLQFEFLRALLKGARDEGLHTALDTCGFAAPDHLRQLLPLVDLFLYDVKLMDAERHRALTGVSNRLILDNLWLVAAAEANLWLRVPLLPGLNDAPADLEALAQFAASVGCVRQVNILPYHPTGLAKLNRLNQPFRLPDLHPPTSEQLSAAVRCFAHYGLITKIGG